MAPLGATYWRDLDGLDAEAKNLPADALQLHPLAVGNLTLRSAPEDRRVRQLHQHRCIKLRRPTLGPESTRRFVLKSAVAS